MKNKCSCSFQCVRHALFVTIKTLYMCVCRRERLISFGEEARQAFIVIILFHIWLSLKLLKLAL